MFSTPLLSPNVFKILPILRPGQENTDQQFYYTIITWKYYHILFFLNSSGFIDNFVGFLNP